MGDPIMLLLSGCFFLCLLLALFKFLHRFWWTPVYMQNLLGSRGIEGPSYKFIHGNNKEILEMRNEALTKPLGLSDDILPRVLPHVYTWKNKYGKNYLSWRGGQPQLAITELELIKEVLNNRDKAYQKAPPPFYIKKLMGNGLATSVGERWIRHRKLINHAFQGECLKKMIPEMIVSVEMMLRSWKLQQGKEIEVFEEFRLLTSDIISRTAFGSSYLEGKNIFDMTKTYSDIIRRNVFKIRLPGISEIWKTSDETEADKLLSLMRSSVMRIIKKREEKVKLGDRDDFGNDFLGLLLQAYYDVDENKRILVQDLIDECKTFYISGQETSNSLISWTVLLLAIHTDWQDKAREEVIKFFGHQNPHPNDLSKLNTITMIINEALRLYPPALVFVRKCEREVRLGKMILPANLHLFISNLVVHRDPVIWGDDAHLFKPERFSEGVAKATNNNVSAYFPFGIGPRTCVGFNFATMVAKVVLTMILQRYRFTLSPAYVHSPVLNSLLVPQHGIQVILHSLQSEENPS
ncbi:CYP749A22 protein [Hibiscus syriacus]|uniref:CYP749A22 protein n=1 Tax=Hibiscus syriacus TaxID=106335 RepID=A0A6A3B2Q6_HIBSY|nr:cytochrome P450 CYP749A22-like [Hibiscus syriacus]KAE8710158.1 CYP749A22 protein [Hibiscus syriacus]